MDATQNGKLTASPVRLFDEHVDDLGKSGLSDETITVMGARSLTPAELEKALGYVLNGTQSALELPYPSLNFSRFKLFPSASDGNGQSIRYLQAKNSGTHLYVLPAVQRLLNDSSVSIYFTEGEKKAAKATQEGFRAWDSAGYGTGSNPVRQTASASLTASFTSIVKKSSFQIRTSGRGRTYCSLCTPWVGSWSHAAQRQVWSSWHRQTVRKSVSMTSLLPTVPWPSVAFSVYH